MYNNEDYDLEEEQDEEMRKSNNFFLDFYNNNKKIVWIVVGIILFFILASILTKGGSTKTNESTEKIENVVVSLREENLSVQLESGKYIEVLTTNKKGEPVQRNTATVTWTSLDTNIVAVENSGYVKGIGLGTTKVTGVYYDEKTKQSETLVCNVTVYKGNPNIEVSAIQLPDGELIMMTNSEYKLTPIVFPEGGYVVSKSFASSNTSIVGVDQDGNVKAFKVGTAKITMKVNGKVSSDILVRVVGKTVEVGIVRMPNKISFSTSLLKLKEGEKQFLNYETVPALNNETVSKESNEMVSLENNGYLEWKSENPDIASVDQLGEVTAIKEGTTTITVKALNGTDASIKIEVVKDIVKVEKIIINSTISMIAGTTEPLQPYIFPEDASNKAVEFYSSNSNVAYVEKTNPGSTEGVIHAIKEGTATIEIYSVDGVASAKINVTVIGNGSSQPVITPTPYMPYVTSTPSSTPNSGGSGGSSGSGCYGKMYPEREYSVSSADSYNPNGTMWSTYKCVVANGGSNAPVSPKVYISDGAKNTKKLKICTKYSATGDPGNCALSSAQTTTSWSDEFTQQGYYVIMIWEYKSDGSLRRGPDKWYVWINNGGTSGGSTCSSITNGSACFNSGCYWDYSNSICRNSSSSTPKPGTSVSGLSIDFPNNTITPIIGGKVYVWMEINITNPSSSGKNDIYFCVNESGSKSKSPTSASKGTWLYKSYYYQPSGTCNRGTNLTSGYWQTYVPENTKICVSSVVDGVSSSDKCVTSRKVSSSSGSGSSSGSSSSDNQLGCCYLYLGKWWFESNADYCSEMGASVDITKAECEGKNK